MLQSLYLLVVSPQLYFLMCCLKWLRANGNRQKSALPSGTTNLELVPCLGDQSFGLKKCLSVNLIPSHSSRMVKKEDVKSKVVE